MRTKKVKAREQPLVSPVEVAALRRENAFLREELKGQKVFFEAQIKVLTKQREIAERRVNELTSGKILQAKAVMKRDL